MEKKDPKAFDAGAPTSLGVLYYRVPGFPMGFGDKKKARHYLEEAVRNAPNGLDAHYFYGDFLQEQAEYAKSAEVLKHALTLPAHPERPIWDKNRRIVIQELIEKVQNKAENKETRGLRLRRNVERHRAPIQAALPDSAAV